MPNPSTLLTNTNNESITISLRQTISLVRSLAALKLLHGVVYVFGANPETTRGKSVKQAIDRTENRIVDISLSIIPESLGLRNRTDFSTATDGTIALNPRRCRCMLETGGIASESSQSYVMQISSSIMPAIYMTRLEGSSEQVSEQQTQGLPNTTSVIDSMQVVPSDSIYSSIMRPSEARFINSEASGTQPNMPVLVSQYLNIVPERPQYSQSRQSSLDYDQLRLSRETQGDELGELDGLSTIRSFQSFPGKFPISDSMEFSSLATASHQLRGRGTTSVRPFSDM